MFGVGSYVSGGGKTILNLPVGTTLERARWWSLKIAERIRLEPELYAQVPEGAALCVLPEDDPEVARHNLLQTEAQEGNVVLIVVTGGPELEIIVWQDHMM